MTAYSALRCNPQVETTLTEATFIHTSEAKNTHWLTDLRAHTHMQKWPGHTLYMEKNAHKHLIKGTRAQWRAHMPMH